MVRYAMGNVAAAIADLDVALKLDPIDHDLHFQRGRMHGELADYRKAIADFTAYIESHPQEARGYGMRALAHFGNGDTQRAWADAARACQLQETAERE